MSASGGFRHDSQRPLSLQSGRSAYPATDCSSLVMLVCDSVSNRAPIWRLLRDLSATVVAGGDEIRAPIKHQLFHGKGIDRVDAHLLASVAFTAGTALWTRDKRLRSRPRSTGRTFRNADTR